MLFNPITYFLELDFSIYIFVSFGFYGVMLLLKKLIFNRGV